MQDDCNIFRSKSMAEYFVIWLNKWVKYCQELTEVLVCCFFVRYVFYVKSLVLVVGTVLVKLKGFQKLTLTDQALQIWFDVLQIGKPKAAAAGLQEAFGCVLAEDLVAVEDLPRFDKSAMDGYAVKSSDLAGATQFKPRFSS